MTVILQAPYPLIQTTTLLPDPGFSDSEAALDEVIQKRTMTGSLYTYIKTKNNRRKLVMQFKLARLKSLELKAFLRAYYRSKIKLTDHLEQVWIGNFTSNPFNFEINKSMDNTTLEFEGIEQ